MKTVLLPCGQRVPALGQGTWNMGDDLARRAEELATLRMGVDVGLTVIDTAEMYGDGRSESLVGEAIAGRRDDVFLVSKVYPYNASRKAMRRSCEASLRRLRTDRIDLYLLHWAGSVPLEETVGAFEGLRRDGLIRHFGVSNLDLADMRALCEVPGGPGVQANQLLYNLTRRGIEHALLPWLHERGVPLMAYSPIEQGRLLGDLRLVEFAARHAMTPAQVSLAWLLARDAVIAIPKTSSRERLADNVKALEHPLDAGALAELERLFPPPRGPVPLEML